MDPKEQLNAFEQIESAGMDVLAVFHSHPTGPPVPSPTDIEEAAYQVISIIWSPVDGEWQARGFWIEDGHAAEVPLAVV
jgi:proteasome lid subunit RPN8/RPN11